MLLILQFFPGEDVQVDDAVEHHGQDFVRIPAAGPNLILHDQLRRGGHSRRLRGRLEPQGSGLRPVQRSR